jgi:SAM-dependent methyltransferase
MKLSRLITYKHMVDGLSVNHINDEIESLLQRVETDLSVQNIDFDNIKLRVSANKKSVLDTLKIIDGDLQKFKTELDQFVHDVEQPYYTKSMDMYQESLSDSADYILDRGNFKKLLYDPETFDFFCNRVRSHAGWQWPAMEIRPAMGEVTESLVACDPLYLVDHEPDLFKVVKDKWTPEYQRRLRYYTVKENEKRIFHQLPHAQFGIIVAVDFFNFRPLLLIERYLTEIFSLLRPGGMAIFTYNNCDLPIGVDNFENSYYCYTPGKQIKEISTKIGFKIAASFDLENNVSWLELRRPGTKSSLRGGQTLGRVENI